LKIVAILAAPVGCVARSSRNGKVEPDVDIRNIRNTRAFARGILVDFVEGARAVVAGFSAKSRRRTIFDFD